MMRAEDTIQEFRTESVRYAILTMNGAAWDKAVTGNIKQNIIKTVYHLVQKCGIF